MSNIERRTIQIEDCEIREAADGNGRTFVGYASVFDTPTTINERGRSFREKITPSAFNRALNEGQDVKLLLNHNPDLVLGRAGKNMTLSVDSRGLRVEAELPNTSVANDLIENMRQGIISHMSFGFSTRGIKGADSWAVGADGIAERSVNDLNLFDVSPVVYPAYDTTEASIRVSDEVRAKLDELETRDPEDIVNVPVDKDVAEMVAEVASTAVAALTSILDLGDEEDMQQNSNEPDAEERQGKVLSEASMGHVNAAMGHLQALLDAANNQDADDDINDDLVDMGYNSAKLLTERRWRLIQMLSAGVDVADEIRAINYELRYSQAERDEMAKNGEAMPDGSFPIKNQHDLESAIRLNGHSGKYSQQQVRDHIKARAKALGLESLIPDSWS